jgi:hypothetical protein
MSETECWTAREPPLDFDERKLWRGELGPDVAEELASK